MKKMLPILIVILLFAQGISKPVGIRDLQLNVDGLYYSPYTDTPFTGVVSGPYTEVIHHYNKNTFVKKNVQGKIIDGKKVGIWTTYSEKGYLKWRSHYKNGNLEFSEDYYENVERVDSIFLHFELVTYCLLVVKVEIHHYSIF